MNTIGTILIIPFYLVILAALCYMVAIFFRILYEEFDMVILGFIIITIMAFIGFCILHWGEV